ncbi:DUF6157 family protein [Sphingobacterium lactis]|uniref:DUF6157 family protein n=1 Tax=Sphingobacterium lactis TaxID=797291 RepID=UPI003F7F6734
MKTHSTNYYNTLITVAEDSKAKEAYIPEKKEGKVTIANLQYDLLNSSNHDMTSDDLLFEIHSIRKDILNEDIVKERNKYFSKGQPCLRTSPLCKTYGWAIFHDDKGKVSLINPNSEKYEELMHNDDIKKIPAMRSSKA